MSFLKHQSTLCVKSGFTIHQMLICNPRTHAHQFINVRVNALTMPQLKRTCDKQEHMFTFEFLHCTPALLFIIIPDRDSISAKHIKTLNIMNACIILSQ